MVYKADAVPVGEDQAPHIELTREVVRRFNNFYGPVFPEPKTLLTATPRIPGHRRAQDVEVVRQRHLPEGPAGGGAREAEADGHRPRAQAAHRPRQPRHLPGLRPAQGLLAGGDAGLGGAGLPHAPASAAWTARAGSPTTCSSGWQAIHARRPEYASRPDTVWDILKEGSRRAREVAARDHGRGAGGDEGEYRYRQRPAVRRAGDVRETSRPSAPAEPARGLRRGRRVLAARGRAAHPAPRVRRPARPAAVPDPQRTSIDIHDIPIAPITRQYMEYLDLMQRAEPRRGGRVHGDGGHAHPHQVEDAGAASTPPRPQGEEEGEDPREELVQRLLEFQRYKEAAGVLHQKAPDPRRHLDAARHRRARLRRRRRGDAGGRPLRPHQRLQGAAGAAQDAPRPRGGGRGQERRAAHGGAAGAAPRGRVAGVPGAVRQPRRPRPT